MFSVLLRGPPWTKMSWLFSAPHRRQKGVKAVLRAPPRPSADKKVSKLFSAPLRVPPRTKEVLDVLRAPPRPSADKKVSKPFSASLRAPPRTKKVLPFYVSLRPPPRTKANSSSTQLFTKNSKLTTKNCPSFSAPLRVT